MSSQYSDSNVKYIYEVFTIVIRASSISFMRTKGKRSVFSNQPINLGYIFSLRNLAVISLKADLVFHFDV